MNTKVTHSLASLQKLKKLSTIMVQLAEQGEWDALLSHDNNRLLILQDHTGKVESVESSTQQQLKNEIKELDERIKYLAHIERKAVMEKELRQKAQLAAQSSYKLALISSTGQ